MSEAGDTIKRLKMTIPRAKRGALEKLFYYWLAEFAPRHFTREAFNRYGREYGASAKRDMAQYLKRHESDIKRGKKSKDARPGRESGKLEHAFLQGTHIFSRSLQSLTVRWPALPKYAGMRNRYSGFVLSKALVEISQVELSELELRFIEFLQGELNKTEFGGAGFGRAVVKGTNSGRLA